MTVFDIPELPMTEHSYRGKTHFERERGRWVWLLNNFGPRENLKSHSVKLVRHSVKELSGQELESSFKLVLCALQKKGFISESTAISYDWEKSKRDNQRISIELK